MNSEQFTALNRVIDHYIQDECTHAQGAGDPPGHIADSLMTLDNYRNARVRNKPGNDDSHGPSVTERDSKEMEVRWAKETIGLVAVDLNNAYAEIVIDRDGHTIPSGKLNSAARQLEEAMDRLGLTHVPDLPF